MPDHKCQEEYIRRINKVQDYIEQHIDRSLSIEELSNAAGFSKYHFSRIFQGILHEPLAHYVNRIRMEKALFLLAHRTDKNMTEIAYAFGLSSSAVFSRAFKNYYELSPREYRNQYSKNCKASFLLSEYNKSTEKKEWAGKPANKPANKPADGSAGKPADKPRGKPAANTFPVSGQIIIENLKEKEAAYVRHTGTYETLAKEYAGMIQTLFEHAMKQQLLIDGKNWVLAMYHDNPEFGKESQFRTSLCLTVPEGYQIQEDGILGRMKLEGGLYAVGHFRIQKDQYGDAWNYMYQEWISGSGFVPRDYNPFEVYRNITSSDDNQIHEVDIYVPIEPIRF